MKLRLSSFIILLSSFALLNTASAQWIIDGQQVQTLNLNVSDPQALYTDGSREMTAPLAFSSALTATSGMARATIPWDAGETDFFVIDAGTEALKLADTGNIGLKIGTLILRETSLTQTDEGTSIDLQGHMLSGGWLIDEVLPYPEAVISRGFADGKYMIAGGTATQPLKFAQSLTATNGALQIYSSDNADHLGFFKTLSFQDGLQFCTEGSAALLFGSGNDGLLVGMANIMQLEYGKRINFETGELTGSAGTQQWHVTTDPVDNSGIVSKGYADARYLRQGVDLTTPLAFAASYTATGGMFRAYIPWDDQNSDLFVFNGDDECIDLSADQNVAFRIGGVMIDTSGITGHGCTVGFEDKTFFGGWKTATVPDADTAVINRSYADARYLRSVTNLTAPLTFAGSELLYGGSGIQGFGNFVSVEEGVLFGDWSLESVVNADEAIITRAFADNRYLRSDTPLTAPIDFDPAYSGAAFKAYAVDDGITVGYFYPRTDENGLRLSGSTSSLLIGTPAEGLNLYTSSLYYSGTGARIGFEDRELDGGQWSVTASPTAAGGIVSKGYADGRYLQRTEGITTNHTIQAGDTLVISNGLITAINP